MLFGREEEEELVVFDFTLKVLGKPNHHPPLYEQEKRNPQWGPGGLSINPITFQPVLPFLLMWRVPNS